MNRDLRKHLAIDCDFSFSHGTHETAVADVVSGSCSRKTSNPQSTEIAFLYAAIAISVNAGTINCFGRTANLTS